VRPVTDQLARGPTSGSKPALEGWRTWLFIGATGFGGPAAQIALLHREVVERQRWLDEEEFLAAMRICMLLPGPEAQQLATYAGWRIGGLPGGLLSGSLFVLPGAVLVTLLAWLHAVGEKSPFVTAAFAGTRPAVVALIVLACSRIGRKSLTSPATAVVALAALVAVAAGVSFPIVLFVAGAVGFCMPADGRAGGKAGETLARPTAASMEPRPRARSLLIVVAVAASLWLAALAAVRLFGLAGDRGTAIATLFTETTLLSFGGAYAVVPWALDESLARGWLEAGERFDALAMGEATPGPLILVTTFIGFLAGYRTALPGNAAAGFAGAAVATLFAFLPSFALILAVAPAVRSIHASPRLRQTMSTIGAAIVAAILILAIRLAAEAFAPAGRVELLPIAVALTAGITLWRGWASAPVVIVVAAAVGLLARP